MFKRFSVLCIALLWILPSLAQELSQSDLDVIDEINASIETTLSSRTFSVEGTQSITQNIINGDFAVEQEGEGEFYGDYINDEQQHLYVILEQSVEQSFGNESFKTEFAQEILINTDGLYVKFLFIEPDTFSSLYPNDWTLFEEDNNDYQGLESFSTEDFLQLADSQQTAMPFASFVNAIVQVEELDNLDINGQNMTVYQSIIDATLLFTGESMSQALEVLTSHVIGSSTDMFELEVGDDAFIEYIFYIGQDDGLLHRVDSVLELQIIFDGEQLGQDDLEIVQTVEQSFDYFNFNEPITLPEPSS